MSRLQGLQGRAGLGVTPSLSSRQQAAFRAARLVDQPVGRSTVDQPDAAAAARLHGFADAFECQPLCSEDPERYRVARDALAAYLRIMADERTPRVKTPSEMLCDLAQAVRRLGPDRGNPSRFRNAKKTIACNLRLIAAELEKDRSHGVE